MKLELTKYPEGAGTFDVPAAIGTELISAGVARPVGPTYDAAWAAMLRRGNHKLTEKEKKAFSILSPSRGAIAPPHSFLKEFQSRTTAKIGVQPHYSVVWSKAGEKQVLVSLGMPMALRVGDTDIQGPEAVPPTWEQLPEEMWKHSSGLLRLDLATIDLPAFDLQEVLLEFASDAFANKVKHDLHGCGPFVRKGIVCLSTTDFTLLRLDERFADFGQVAFIAFGRIGMRHPSKPSPLDIDPGR